MEEKKEFLYEQPGTLRKLLGGVIFLVAVILVMYLVRTSMRMRSAYGYIGETLVENVDTAGVPLKNNGKLVYFGAFTRSNDSITDPMFGIGGKYLAVRRFVQYYQWVETKYTEHEKVDGEDKYRTHYEYGLGWVDAPVNSANFDEKRGHENVTPLTIDSKITLAPNVKMGTYTVGKDIMESIAHLSVEPSDMEIDIEKARKPLVKALLNMKIHLGRNAIYYGNDPNEPEVGDVVVRFEVANPMFLYVLAMVEKGSLEPFNFKAVDRKYFKIDVKPFDPKKELEAESGGYIYLVISACLIGWLLIVWAVHWLRGIVVYPMRRLPYIGKAIPDANDGLTLWIVGTYLAIAVIVVCYLIALLTT